MDGMNMYEEHPKESTITSGYHLLKLSKSLGTNLSFKNKLYSYLLVTENYKKQF